MAAAKRRSAGGASDPYFANVVFLSNYATDASDVKLHPVSLFGNTAVSGGALVLDGAGDYAQSAASADFNLANVAWTIEGFVTATAARLEVIGSVSGTIAQWGGSDRIQAHIERMADGKIRVNHGDSGGIYVNQVTTAAVAQGVKTHVAVCWDGTHLRVGISGVVQSFSTSFEAATASNQRVNVGGDPTYAPWAEFTGSISAWRITKGVARYTANFTPPIDPFPEA